MAVKIFPYVGGGGGGGSSSGEPVPVYRLTNDQAWAETTERGESKFTDERGATLLRIKKDGAYVRAVSSIRTESSYATGGAIADVAREHYDPSQPVALYRLPNGRLFLYGGIAGSAASVEDGAGGWVEVQPPSRPTDIGARRSEVVEFAHGMLPDGRVIVAGGSLWATQVGAPGYANDTFLYSDAGGWSTGPVLSSPRTIGAFAVANGRFMVFGGVEWTDLGGGSHALTPTAVCEAFNPATDEWEPIADMPVAHGAMSAAVVLDDGRVLVFGGSSAARAHIYDPITDVWVACAEDQDFGAYTWTRFAMTTLGGKVYVAGGTLEAGEDFVGYAKTVRMYDPATDAWVGLPDLNVGRRRGSLISRGGTLTYVGGLGADNDVTSWTMELYDPKQNTWVKGDAPCQSAGGSVLVESDGVVVQGGTLGEDQPLSTRDFVTPNFVFFSRHNGVDTDDWGIGQSQYDAYEFSTYAPTFTPTEATVDSTVVPIFTTYGGHSLPFAVQDGTDLRLFLADGAAPTKVGIRTATLEAFLTTPPVITGAVVLPDGGGGFKLRITGRGLSKRDPGATLALQYWVIGGGVVYPTTGGILTNTDTLVEWPLGNVQHALVNIKKWQFTIDPYLNVQVGVQGAYSTSMMWNQV